MRQFVFSRFGIDGLECVERDPPAPGPGEVRVRLHALGLNYRDLMVVQGTYNPRLALPATPISDGAGVVDAVGEGVSQLAVGDRVMSHFVAGWQEGAYRAEYLGTTLGTPGPGLAADQVVLAQEAVLPLPNGYDFEAAATLPIAALTAWSALVTEGHLESGQSVLTLGTGGVSIFALQIARAMGARVLITSRSDEKLDRARALGADETIQTTVQPDWERRVLELTGRRGVDVVVENGGAGTLSRSLRAVRAGGVIALLGALGGLQGELDLAPVLMKRVRIAGILVDSRASFLALTRFLEEHAIQPVIDRVFPFLELAAALEHMKAGRHLGKVVIRV